MRHTKHFAVLLGAALSAAGCATTHLAGEYNPGSQVPLDKPHKIEESHAEPTTLATGHDWVLFWGIVELQSTDMDKKIKGQLRSDEMIKDPEVRNHISLGGALLWIVTAGIVSHHSVDFRGTVVAARELPPPAAPAPVREIRTTEARVPTESELFAESRIDRPLGEVSGDFDDAASRAGLVTLGRVKWDEVAASGRPELRGDIPENRLAGVEPSNVESFYVTTDRFTSDVKSDPKCATRLPGIVFYDAGGRTRCIYSKPTAKLRALEWNGQVGEGKLMTRDDYQRHFEMASEFERRCEKTIESLRTSSKSP
ncbi:MAG TPA: hypothetical protein VFF73_08855 [Planctomycetota bacterium]|nr:hypothetical protein [Planctomycetota bacterium]